MSTKPNTIPTPAEVPPVPPLTILFFGILAVSMSAILIRLAQAEQAPSLVIAAWRTTMASLILLPLALTQRRSELQQMTPADWVLAGSAGGMLGLHFASWISSLEFTSVTNSTVLVTTTPIWVGLASPFFLKEALSRPLKIGIALALIGSVIITLSDSLLVEGWQIVGWRAENTAGGSNPLLGNGLAIVGAITAGGYMLIGRRLRPRLSLLSYTMVVYGLASLTLLILALLAGHNLLGYSSTTYWLCLLMAIFPQLMGHSSFNWALRFLPAAYVSVSVLGEPVSATLLAFFFFQELPTNPGLALLGAIFIFGGILLASWRT